MQRCPADPEGIKEKGYDLHTLPEHVAIQINDTHPTMVIPELIRILTTEEGFTMDEAIDVVSHTCAYTNHTILAEALEKWPLAYIEEVVPQLVPIIKELSDRVAKKYKDEKVQIIDKDKRVTWHISTSTMAIVSTAWQRSIPRS